MIFSKNGGSVDAIDDFGRECSSNLIILGEWRLSWLILGGVWSIFYKKLRGGKKYSLKNSKMGGGRYSSKRNGGR